MILNVAATVILDVQTIKHKEEVNIDETLLW